MVAQASACGSLFPQPASFVWITKYRRPAMVGEVATRVRDRIRDICAQQEVRIMKGPVARDRVHLMVSIPPQVDHQPVAAMVEGQDGAPVVGGVE
jgi:putative transposase